MAREFLNYIASKWVKSSSRRTFRVKNPARPNQILGDFQFSTEEDARKAVASARKTLPMWATVPVPERGKVLYRAAEILEGQVGQLSRSLTMEEGKTLAESEAEVRRAIDVFRFYAGLGSRLDGRTVPSAFPKTLLYTLREPVGVVAVVTPWNFPLAIPAWKIAPALVSGDTVVFKPSSLTPLIALKLVQALEQAGLPGGVLNFVTGPGSAVGAELSTSSEIDAITFTGSTEVGRGIYKARGNSDKMARIQLELGGKNPAIVLPDARLDDVVPIIAKSAFGLTGQACTATSRVIVHPSIREKFIKKIADQARKIKVGDGLRPGVEMGPAVSKDQLDIDRKYVETGVNEGARLVAGGKAKENTRGYFIEPTVFDDITSDMRIAQDEIFGPVLAIMEARNVDEAVELANKSEYGLTAGVYTSNLSNALAFAERVEAGVIKINKTTTGLEYQAPYGGFKGSSASTFKEQGVEALEFFTRIKTVYVGY